MSDAEFLREGAFLTFLGMGVVFSFLSLLVVAMSTMSSLLERFYPEPSPPAAIALRAGDSTADSQLLAVIAAAIHQHRSKR